MTTREQALGALITLVTGAYSWAVAPRRRLKLWTDVPVAERPCCFVFEGGNESYAWPNLRNAKRDLDARLFIYVDSHDPTAVGATQLNNIMDALDAAFEPTGADAVRGHNTLGGLVHSCRIDGSVLKEPGDLDGDGLLLVPVKIIMP